MFLFELLKNEIKISSLNRGDSLFVAIFFLVTISLFPLGVGPDTITLSRIAPGIIWIMALLTSIVSLDRLLSDDLDDGTTEMLVSSNIDYTIIALTKIITHWLTTGLPVILMAPLLGLALQMQGSSIGTLIISLFCGTPTLSLIGTFGSALTLNAKHRGILIPLLVLPLNIPILIFGSSCVTLDNINFDPNGSFLVMIGILLIAITLCPLAISILLKMSIEK
ncbi:MAG: heme exporter protein CcmB [Pseudomonadota bacterium]|nr:heme exporter protein CcmB [Pseudomonadota bacterium]